MTSNNAVDDTTTQQSIEPAQGVRALRGLRVGQGFDAHVVSPGVPCRLVGLLFDDADGCDGHSDGDVGAHAIADALLSAAGLGDLGGFVGVDRPEVKGILGVDLLEACARHVRQHGVDIINVAVQVIANTPKIGPVRDKAQQVLSDAIGAPVSVAATTTDSMGFTGRGQGRAAIATALVVRGAQET